MRRGLFRAALGVSFAIAGVGVLLNLALPLWWQAHGQTLVTITSGSMEPVISPGEQVLIRDWHAGDEVAVGDIVTFANQPGSGGTLTSHRVIDLVQLPDSPGWFLQTQGDANNYPDPDLTPVPNIVGIVESNLDWLGPVMLAAQEPRWRLAAFGPLLVMCAAAEMPALLGRRRTDDDAPGQTPGPPTTS